MASYSCRTAPAPRHSLAASSLGAISSDPFSKGRGGPGGWLILDEPELHMGADIQCLTSRLAARTDASASDNSLV